MSHKAQRLDRVIGSRWNHGIYIAVLAHAHLAGSHGLQLLFQSFGQGQLFFRAGNLLLVVHGLGVKGNIV